jgi:hypothetical protein
MTPEKAAVAMLFVQEGLEQGIIEEVANPAFLRCIHNLVFVRKKNGKLRVC